MKTLYIDIETTPNLVYAWNLRNVFVGLDQIVEPTRVLCATFGGDAGEPEFVAEWDRGGHDRMIRKIHKALDRADAIVHYNGVSFDEKHLNREFLQADLLPPSSYKSIDLYRTVKQRFKFASSKLEQVLRELSTPQQKLHTNFGLWARAMAGEQSACDEMREYNVRDVQVLRDLYIRLRPWIERHPNVALIDGVAFGCTRCGSTNVIKFGHYYTSAGRFQRYRCRDCGSDSRAPQRDETTGLREVPR